jgi:hypothetical protein
LLKINQWSCRSLRPFVSLITNLVLLIIWDLPWTLLSIYSICTHYLFLNVGIRLLKLNKPILLV